jgi:hypothetical protein
VIQHFLPSVTMTDASRETAGSAVHGVTICLPNFWPDRPEVWFAQVEAQFELVSVTHQRTNFNYIVSQLNQQQAAEVEDIITAPPESDPYDRLKEELILRLSSSPEQRVRQLLSQEEMGDRKPLQFLRHLKSLAPDVPDDFLRIIWTNQLPPHVQAILAGKSNDNLDSVSRLADKISEVALSPTTASKTTTTPDTTTLLLKGIEDLTQQIAMLWPSPNHNQFKPKPHYHPLSRGHDQIHPANLPDICWYHWKFGSQARKCNPPCSHQQKVQRPRQDMQQSGNAPGR